MNEEELAAILMESRINNAQKNITGMLLYGEGTFIQVLEGEKETVLTLYHKIKDDIRHRGIINMVSGETTERTFPEWSMGFKTTDAETLNLLKGYIDPAKIELLNTKTSSRPTVMLKTFVQTNRLAF
jgi:hypothetical protein